MSRPLATLAWQIGIVVVLLALWQWAWSLKPYAPWAVPDLFDPYFVSRPSEIFAQFLRLSCLHPKPGEWAMPGGTAFSACTARYENNLWFATFVTLRNTLFGFLTGVTSGVVLGLLLGRSPRLAEIASPFVAHGVVELLRSLDGDGAAGVDVAVDERLERRRQEVDRRVLPRRVVLHLRQAAELGLERVEASWLLAAQE